ncbi:MAG: glycosyltransferase family 39 protein, partial [Ruminiclostridium sp.]
MAGTNTLIYLIARKISGDYTARFVSLLYLLYPAPYFLAAVLTNQHFAAAMFLLAVYILLIKQLNFAVKGIIAGVIMSLGNTVRPLGIVLIAATMLWGLVETIRSKKVTKIGIIVLLVITYFLVNLGSSAMIRHADINPDGLANNFPLWKFVVGLNYDSKGQFSYEDQNNIFYIQDQNKRNTVSKQVIRERLSIAPAKLVNLLNTKQIAMWAGLDTLRWGFYQQIDGKLVPSEVIEKFEPNILKAEKMYYIIIFILMFLGLCKVFVNKRVLPEITLLSLILLCYFGAHILIEIQVRYRYFAVILVFIIAAKGSELLFPKLKGYREIIDRKY